MSKKPLKQIPAFASEAEERAFWDTHDSTDYMDWDQAVEVPPEAFRNLTRSAPRVQVTAEVPQDTWADLHALAARRGVTAQALAGAMLSESIEKAKKSA